MNKLLVSLWRKRRAWLITLGLLWLAACAPVKIPTADETPTREASATIPAPTAATTPAPATPRAPLAPTGAAAPAPTPTLGALPTGGTLTVGAIGKMSNDVNALPAIVQSALFDSLLQIDPANGALKPALAEAYQVSNDAATITFRLRVGVRFHNGDPLTADDVAATFKAFSDPGFRGTPITDFTAFTRAIALDSQTVQVTFSEGYCPALASIGLLKILPRSVTTSANFPRLTPAQMIGTGAFKLSALTAEQFTLERNAEYYRGALPLDALTVRMYGDAPAARAAFAAKQIDLVPGAPGEWAALKKLTDAHIVAADANELIALVFNVDTPALNDPRVRQALSYAINRPALLDDLDGQARLLDASVLPEFWAYPKNLPAYSFDVARAKQLLADAGWQTGDGALKKNGKALRLDLWAEADDPVLEPLAFRLREMYAPLGIQIDLALDDRPGWITRAFQHRFDLLLLARKIPPDLDQRWYWQTDQNVKGTGFNFGSYSNPRMDGFFKDGLKMPVCEPNARAAIFAETERTLIADAPAAFLLAPKKYLAARERVLGIAPSPFAGDYWNLHEWRVK